MTSKKEIIVIIFFSLITVKCSISPTPNSSEENFEYVVDIPEMGVDSINISIEVNHFKDDTISFIMPPLYADNPFLVSTNINVKHIKIEENGSQNSYISGSIPVGAHISSTIKFPINENATLSYSVFFNYKTDESSKHMPLPHIGNATGYIQGNYIFAIPYQRNETALIWRAPLNITTHYKTGSNILFFGDPTPSANYANAYELLFSNSVLLSNTATDHLLINGHVVAGQKFNLVNSNPDMVFTEEAIKDIDSSFSIILQDIIPKIGQLEPQLTIITGVNDKIGLEGMFAFSLFNPKESDPDGWLSMTEAHEVMHSWIGIRTGDIDMPWWKEGTTFYIGFLIAKRNNLCSQKLFQQQLAMRDLSSIPATDKYTLTNPAIRDSLYLDENMGAMVYRRGSQLNMLMDSKIREISNGKHDLFETLTNFLREYNGKSFYKNEYLSYIETRTGVDVSDLINSYEQLPGPIPDSVLLTSYKYLGNSGAIGAFSEDSIDIYREIRNDMMPFEK